MGGGTTGAVDATAVDATANLGNIDAADKNNITPRMILRTNPRRNLLLSLLLLLVHDEDEEGFVATLITVEVCF